MSKEKIHLEYSINGTSKNLIWLAISTPSGLETWFADRVVSDDRNVTFYWGKTETREAEIVAARSYTFIRYHWKDDEDERSFFELRMSNNEMTGDYHLEMIETADKEDVDSQIELWDSQIETLRRTNGM